MVNLDHDVIRGVVRRLLEADLSGLAHVVVRMDASGDTSSRETGRGGL